ncbi:MAG: purine-nucleoside phosphorylase [Anaerolineales bacterium]|nr:MAG: purine-nucleoside phosphorylase [Anaerolineales bacterium]
MYPILEFDPDRKAFVEPSDIADPLDVSEHCIICFFGEVIEKVVSEHKAEVLTHNRWEDGPHPLYEIEYSGRRLAFFHPGVGAPLSSGILEEVIAFGCRKFIAIGGCGVLERDMEVGKLIVVSSAVRDEGVSYHYLPPAREVEAQPDVVSKVEGVLKDRGIPFILGKTWTTDAPYRETRSRIDARRGEGCIAVEMEAAAMMSVAEFRKVAFGQILYAGDDLSGDDWDNRGWQSRGDVRDRLFWLAADACLRL